MPTYKTLFMILTAIAQTLLGEQISPTPNSVALALPSTDNHLLELFAASYGVFRCPQPIKDHKSQILNALLADALGRDDAQDKKVTKLYDAICTITDHNTWMQNQFLYLLNSGLKFKLFDHDPKQDTTIPKYAEYDLLSHTIKLILPNSIDQKRLGPFGFSEYFGKAIYQAIRHKQYLVKNEKFMPTFYYPNDDAGVDEFLEEIQNGAERIDAFSKYFTSDEEERTVEDEKKAKIYKKITTQYKRRRFRIIEDAGFLSKEVIHRINIDGEIIPASSPATNSDEQLKIYVDYVEVKPNGEQWLFGYTTDKDDSIYQAFLNDFRSEFEETFQSLKEKLIHTSTKDETIFQLPDDMRKHFFPEIDRRDRKFSNLYAKYELKYYVVPQPGSVG